MADGLVPNPAANTGRMVIALGLLVVLGGLSWFTIDASSVVHIAGYQGQVLQFGDRDVELRWIPLLLLGLFAFRVVMAYLRARMESKGSQQG